MPRVVQQYISRDERACGDLNATYMHNLHRRSFNARKKTHNHAMVLVWLLKNRLLRAR